ncbi:MAG TPA: sigma-70 family RNA polymerase sigma factor [Puia sp.]|nr:sigma-70 family RNA polymerase sigma factor [Puia sp.]
MNSTATSELNNDAFLLMQLEQGNGHAFNLLFEKYWELAYSSAYKRLKDADLAKDIVQDIFTHIWINRSTLHFNNLPAYLNRAVRNKVIKALAKQRAIHPFFDVLENHSEKAFCADNPLLWKEFIKDYENLLSTLPPQRQAIFRLRFHDDLPTKNIADLLGLSRKTVQNQLGKAIQKLRVSLMHLWTIFPLILLTHLR